MPLLQRGELVGEGQQQDRYKVRRKVGEGQFSEVYEVEDTTGGGLYALKIERSPDVRTVRQECKTLRRLQQCAQICKARGSGTYGDRFYMVLDLLGNNLVEARRSVQGSRLDLSTAKHVALSLLVPLEAMHREGFIHRDVKPANYAIYPPGAASTEGQWTLIDFGLARRYVDDEGKLLPERTDASFRGSSTYASAQVMEHRDQGRRDDLWSWLYVVVELIAGTLPWRFDGEGGEKPNREAVLQLKQSCMAAPRQLVGTTPCPQAIVELSSYLRGLQFDAEPDYDWVRSLVSRLDEEPLSGVSDEAQPMAVDQAPRQQEQQQQQKEQYQQQHQPGGPSCDLPLAGQGSGGELGAGVAVPVAAWGASTLPSRPAESPPPPLPLPPPPALGSPLPLMLDLEGILTMPGWSGGQSDAAALGSQQAGGQPNGTLEAVPALQLQATVEQRSQKLPGLEPALGKQGSGLTLCLPAGAPANEPELSSGAAAAADDGDAPAHGLARAIRASGAAEPAAAPFEAMPAQQQQQPLEKARLPEGGGVPSMPRRRGMQEAQQQAGQAGLRATDEAGVGGREARRAPQLEQHPQQERPREGLSKPPRSRPSSAAAAGSSAAARAAPEKTGGKGHAGHAPSGINGAVAPAAPAVADAAAGTGGGGGVSKRGVKEGTAQGSQPDKGKRTDRIVAGSGSRASGGAADGSGRDGRQGRGQSGERLKDTRPPSSSQQQQQRPQPWHRGSSRSRSRSRSPRSPSLSPSRSRSESYHRQQQHQRKRRRSYSRSPSSSRSRSRSRSHSRRRSDRSRDRDRDRDMDRSRSRDRDRDSRDRSRSRERERDRRERRDRRGNRSRSRSRTRYRSRSRERPEAAIKGRPQDTSAHLNDPIVKRYREMLDYVFALKQGGISPAGEKACRQLRALAPAEALGAICWVLDDVGSQATAKQSQLAAQLLEDVSAFAAGLARKCVELQEARP